LKFGTETDAPVTTPRTFTITVNDGADNSTTATATVNVTAVNDTPVNNVTDSTIEVHSNTPFKLTGLSIDDVDAGTANNVTTSLAAPEGTFTVGNGANGTNGGIAGGATITNGANSVTLTGTVEQINTTLSSDKVFFTAKDDTGTGF